MNTYLKEISRSMKMLSKNKKTIFIGQSVKYSGSSIYVSLKNVPNQKKIELPVSINDIVLAGNDVELIAKSLNFQGEMYNIDSPSPESLFLLAKESIISNHYIEPNPKYLREVNAKKPSLLKNTPIVK